MSNGTPSPDETTRSRLAINTVKWGCIFVAVLAGVIILAAEDKDKAAQLVLTGILPLVGTWVGTVLAFYFAKDNFESASRQTLAVMGVEDRLKSIAVTEAMIDMKTADKKSLAVGEDPLKLCVQSLIGDMQAKQRNRIPVLSATNVPVYAIHLSTAAEFTSAEAVTRAGDPAAVKALTIGDMKQKAPALFRKIEAWRAVPKAATLADVKAVMASEMDCSDVFVTESGKMDSPAVGWITNVRLAEHARV